MGDLENAELPMQLEGVVMTFKQKPGEIEEETPAQYRHDDRSCTNKADRQFAFTPIIRNTTDAAAAALMLINRGDTDPRSSFSAQMSSVMNKNNNTGKFGMMSEGAGSREPEEDEEEKPMIKFIKKNGDSSSSAGESS